MEKGFYSSCSFILDTMQKVLHLQSLKLAILITQQDLISLPNISKSSCIRYTVDQLMFAAINVCVLSNQSISLAINVCDLGSQ